MCVTITNCYRCQDRNVSSPLMSILLHGLKRESSEQAKTVKHKASMMTIIYEEGLLRGKKNAHKK